MRPKTIERHRRLATRDLLKSLTEAKRAIDAADRAKTRLFKLTERDADKQVPEGTGK